MVTNGRAIESSPVVSISKMWPVSQDGHGFIKMAVMSVPGRPGHTELYFGDDKTGKPFEMAHLFPEPIYCMLIGHPISTMYVYDGKDCAYVPLERVEWVRFIETAIVGYVKWRGETPGSSEYRNTFHRTYELYTFSPVI